MNSSDLTYRLGTASFVSTVSHLVRCAESFHPPLYTYVNIELYAHKICDRAVTFEAWAGDALVGLLAAYLNNYNTRVGYITNVSVIDEYQGHGIATKLLHQSIEFASWRDFENLQLEVTADNLKARGLYERIGFVVTKAHNCRLQMNYMIKVLQRDDQ